MLRFFSITLLLALKVLAAWGENSTNYGDLKYSFEDSFKHDKRLQCEEVAKAGTNVPEIFEVFIGQSKKVDLYFETFVAKDIIEVSYQNEKIYSSGCIGTNGYKKTTLSIDGFSDIITITVLPNCKGNEPTTRWQFYIDCK